MVCVPKMFTAHRAGTVPACGSSPGPVTVATAVPTVDPLAPQAMFHQVIALNSGLQVSETLTFREGE